MELKRCLVHDKFANLQSGSARTLGGTELDCGRLRWFPCSLAVTIVLNSDFENTWVVDQGCCVSNAVEV